MSEKVGVKGILKQENNVYKNLKFILDRSGESYQEIRDQIKHTLNLIERLKESDDEVICKPDTNETTFIYRIDNSKETEEAIRIGLNDLKSTIPFVLALNKSIQSITCEGVKYEILKNEEIEDSQFKIITIINSEGRMHEVLIKKYQKIYIAILVEKQKNNLYKVLPFPTNMPKLFCKFPLIGTEDYSFPVIINAPEFDIEKDRNAIHEGNQENNKIIQISIELYKSLIELACKNSWLNLYNLCYLNKDTKSSIQKNNNKNIKEIFEYMKIVDVNLRGKHYGRCAIKEYNYSENKNENLIAIPTAKKDFRDTFWELINTLGCYYIPTKESYIQWNAIFETNIDIKTINDHLIKDKDLWYIKDKFSGNGCDIFTWLNSYYLFWINVEGKENFIDNGYVLNQNYKFIKVSKAYLDKDIDEDLKDILVNLEDDIKETLLAKEINLGEESILESRDNTYVSNQIQNKVNRILSDETINNTKRSKETQLIFNKITDWFLKKSQESEQLFDTLYNKRNLLSTPEENIRRFKIAEKIESNNITYEQLDDIIENRNKIAYIIDNLDDLSGDEIKQQLKHIPKKSEFGFEKFKEMQERAIKNIYNYVSSLSVYELDENLEKWNESRYFDTVFKAKRNGQDIRIIIRPSDDNKIIFFNDEELEALDDTDYELWTDDDQGNTRIVTLGDIIKTTGISVIPLRNIYIK